MGLKLGRCFGARYYLKSDWKDIRDWMANEVYFQLIDEGCDFGNIQGGLNAQRRFESEANDLLEKILEKETWLKQNKVLEALEVYGVEYQEGFFG